MERYKTYKPSRVIWINEFPSHWIEKQNKHILYEKKDEVGIEWKNYQLLSLSKKGVIKRDIDSGKGKFPESFENYKKVECDDLIFCLYDIEETPRTVGLSNYRGMITSSYKIYKCSENPKFVYYWYLTIDDFKGLKPFYTGMRNVVRPETFLSLKIYLPPLQEQNQIVQFLDSKTELIDKLISTKERKISLLKEQRTSFINQVVTKGLNPNVKMKDSGVEWIGEIPENWEIKPLFTQCYNTKRKNNKFELPILSLSYGKIKIRNIETNFGLLPESFDNYQIIEKGDVVLRLTDLQNDKTSLRVGYSELKGLITPVYVSLGSKTSMNSKFLFYQLYNSDIKKVLYSLGGGLRQTLRYDELKRFPLVVIPIEEQKLIVEFIESNNKIIDSTIELEQKKIDLLKEYRQSLISEVVTGKIKVTTYE